MSIKILATGDIHIGQRVSGIPGIESEVSARDTWNQIVSWSIENKIDALALTGDIIDRNNRYYEAIGPLEAGFRELEKNGVEVFMVAGNHDFDVLPQIVNSGNFPNVHLLGSKGAWQIIEFKGIQIAGWSFPSEHFYDDPLKTFDDGQLKQNMPCIGLLHGDLYDKSSKYAPLNINLLKSKSLNAWILGHIHKSEEWDGLPYVCYTGSPLSMSPKEKGIHGPVLFGIQNGSVSSPGRVLFSSTRFEALDVDVTGINDDTAFRLRLSEKINEKNSSLEKELSGTKILAYRINFTGKHNSPEDISSWANRLYEDYAPQLNSTKIRISGTEINVSPEVDMQSLSQDRTPVGSLARIILEIENNQVSDNLRKMIADWKTQYTRINNWDAYDPVRTKNITEPELDSMAKGYILKESRRLIGELLHQKAKR